MEMLVIKIEGGVVEVSDEGGLIARWKFSRLKDLDLKHYFVGHVAEGLRVCLKVDEEMRK
jgi:hypothetical protein